MVDRFAWGAAGELIPGDELDEDVEEETDVQEGRHSAPWREDLYSRDEDGKFSHGGGGSPTGRSTQGGSTSSAGRPKTSTSTVHAGGGTITVTSGAGGGTIDTGRARLELTKDQAHVFADELGYLGLVKTGTTPTSRAFTVGSERAIPYKGGPNDNGEPSLGLVKRTGVDEFELHLSPHAGATPAEIADTPGITITSRDGYRIEGALKKYASDAAQAEKDAKAAAKADAIRAGRTNPTDIARRATGQAPAPHDPDRRGMPDTVAAVDIPTAGGAVTVHRQAGDDFIHLANGDGRSFALTRPEVQQLGLQVGDDDDEWEGDSKNVVDDDGFTFARLTKAGSNKLAVQIDDQPAFTLTPKEADRITAAADRLSSAQRINTDYGDFDLFHDGNKFAIRQLGDDARPIETKFDRRSWSALGNAVNTVVEGFDEYDDAPDAPDSGVTSKDVKTNVGKVNVALKGGGGDSPDSRLAIMPVEGDDWGIVVDGPRVLDFHAAISGLLEETRRPQPLGEHVTLTEAAGGQAPKGRRFRARLIAGDVQGSSGYYPAAMLRENANVFRQGLPVYLDHPGVTEGYERPERSVRDLAGRLATPATYQGDGLYADVEVYPHWAPVIEAMADDIGMSIRAAGTVEASTQRGIRGPIVTSLTEATSVDFVTAAGAGGRIVALLESARKGNLAPPFKAKKDKAEDVEDEDLEDLEDEDTDEDDEDEDAKKKGKKGELPAFLKKKFKANESDLAEAATVGSWFESRIHLGFTEMADEMFGGGLLTRAERIGLSSAIGEALTAFNGRVEADHPHLYQRDLWADPARDAPPMTDDTITKKGAPMTEGTNTEQPPERGAVTESARDTALAAALAEARRSAEALTEAQTDAARRIAALEEKLAQGDAEKLTLTNDRTARAAVTEALRTSGLHALSHSRVTESVCRTLPTGDDGRLDTVKFGEAITTAIADERTYVASLAEATGAGIPRGLGESLSASEPLTESAFESNLVAQFERLGMSPAAAKVAATGRR